MHHIHDQTGGLRLIQVIDGVDGQGHDTLLLSDFRETVNGEKSGTTLENALREVNNHEHYLKIKSTEHHRAWRSVITLMRNPEWGMGTVHAADAGPKAGQARTVGKMDQVCRTVAIGRPETGDGAACAADAGQHGSPGVLAFKWINRGPHGHGDHGALDIVHMPMRASRWFQVVAQPGAQPTGAEGAATYTQYPTGSRINPRRPTRVLTGASQWKTSA